MRPAAMALSTLLAAGCAGVGARSIPGARADSHETVVEEGGLLVVEEVDGEPDGVDYIDAATVIAASKAKKEQFAALLKAAVVMPGVPMRFASLDLNMAEVETLDEYLDGLTRSHRKDRARFEKDNPGKKYPGLGPDLARTRAELEGQLRGHDAVVLRYIHIKRGDEK